MGLPKSIANIFAARNIITAKDALSLTEFELMELLDVGLSDVKSALAHISEIVSPPYQTALLLMEQRVGNEQLGGHLPTRLKGLDAALCGGIPFGVLTEVVGPAGIGKTQFCLKLSLLAALPAHYGGLDGRVIYIDVESKFSSRRMIEIGARSFPEIFHLKGMAQEMAGRILVLRPTSLSEFTERFDLKEDSIFLSLRNDSVGLEAAKSFKAALIGDNIRSLAECLIACYRKPRMLQLGTMIWEHEQGAPRQHPLGWHISFIKSLAEFSRIPVVVTNQVRSQNRDESCPYSFQVQDKGKTKEDSTRYESHLVAALGIHWAHAVTIRLVLEAKSGQRFIKVAKSPISPPLAFPFIITSSGISLLTDDGTELIGPEINTICCQGHNDIINFAGERLH
ncbi:hypothetical protein QYF36_008793 [Acer negundo]|nr:hypothetical protein QYF36_008793 [Acer negundo]